MNFIAETDRFARDLENWKKGHGYTNTDGLRDLMLIWHEFINIPERKAVTYPGVKAQMPLVDHNCGKCGPLTDALTLIYAWRHSQELQNEVATYYPDVEKAEIVEEVKMSFDVPQTFPKVDELLAEPSKIVGEGSGFEDGKIDYSQLKMHELRSIAKLNPELKFSNKTTKEELITLINKL